MKEMQAPSIKQNKIVVKILIIIHVMYPKVKQNITHYCRHKAYLLVSY